MAPRVLSTGTRVNTPRGEGKVVSSFHPIGRGLVAYAVKLDVASKPEPDDGKRPEQTFRPKNRHGMYFRRELEVLA